MPDVWALIFVACMPNAMTGAQCGTIPVGPFDSETACEVNRPMIRRVIAESLIQQGYGAATLDAGTCAPLPPPGEPV